MKIFGCMILFAVSSITGLMLADHETKRHSVLKELSLFLYKLRSGMESRYPIDEIIKRYTSESSPSHIKGYDRKELAAALAILIREGICKSEVKLCLELMEYISRSCDASEIGDRCARLSDVISDKLAIAENECSKKKELYIKLGVFTGLLVCITVI